MFCNYLILLFHHIFICDYSGICHDQIDKSNLCTKQTWYLVNCEQKLYAFDKLNWYGYFKCFKTDSCMINISWNEAHVTFTNVTTLYNNINNTDKVTVVLMITTITITQAGPLNYIFISYVILCRNINIIM